MPDFYTELLEVTRKYLGFAAPRFVKIVLQHIGSTPSNVDKDDLKRFAEEISVAVGKALNSERKAQFKQDVLDLI